MIDKQDYEERACPLCMDGQVKRIPVQTAIERLDGYLYKEDYPAAKKHLEFWLGEARLQNDKRGELSLLSEMMGLARRLNDEASGLDAVKRGFQLIEDEKLFATVSAATIWLNGATTLKAFGKAEEGLPYYEKARAVYESELEKNDALLGGLYNNYALALADCQKPQEAMEYFEKAISIMALQPTGSPEVAITLLNMASLYEDDDERIEGLLEKAWERLNDNKIKHDGYYAFVCRKCAPTFNYYGHFADAKELNERADKIYAGA